MQKIRGLNPEGMMREQPIAMSFLLGLFMGTGVPQFGGEWDSGVAAARDLQIGRQLEVWRC